MSARSGIPSPHPLIADTWYVRGEKRPFEVIHDRGGSWNTMADPLQPAADWALVVNPHATRGPAEHQQQRPRDAQPRRRCQLAPPHRVFGRTRYPHARGAIRDLAADELCRELARRRHALRMDTASLPTVTAVEFHRQDLDHYFMTIDPPEIELIDSGGRAP